MRQADLLQSILKALKVAYVTVRDRLT